MSRVRIIGALILGFLSFSLGCKKDDDDEAPIPVNILSPSAGTSFRVLEDTIRIIGTAKVPDDGPASVYLFLKDESSGALVVPPNYNYVINTRNALEFNYRITDSLLSSGTYRLEVKVSTSDNSGSSSVPINLVAVPKRKLGTLLLTRPDSSRTRLWMADASLNLSHFREMSGDYVGSTLQNATGTFLIARRTVSSTFFKISDGTVLRTINGEQAAPVPSFSFADIQDGTHFLSFYQSTLRGYDSNGNETFRSASQPLDYDYRNMLRAGNYIYAYAHLDLPATEKLFVINYPSGASRSECTLDMRVTGMLPGVNNDIYLFGTRTDGALSVARYYFTTNVANELIANPGLQLLEVVPGPLGADARLLTNQGIYRFDPTALTLQQESSLSGDRMVRDSDSQLIYLIDSLEVKLLSDIDLSVTGTITSTEPVKNVINWYNR